MLSIDTYNLNYCLLLNSLCCSIISLPSNLALAPTYIALNIHALNSFPSRICSLCSRLKHCNILGGDKSLLDEVLTYWSRNIFWSIHLGFPLLGHVILAMYLLAGAVVLGLSNIVSISSRFQLEPVFHNVFLHWLYGTPLAVKDFRSYLLRASAQYGLVCSFSFSAISVWSAMLLAICKKQNEFVPHLPQLAL